MTPNSLRSRYSMASQCLAPCLVLLLTMMSSATAVAKDYLIEVVLFETLGNPASSQSLYVPRIPSAIGLSSNEASSAGFQLISDGLQLGEEADTLKRSGRYRLLRHFAWRQPGLDNNNARAIRINVGKTITVHIPSDYKSYQDFIPASQYASSTADRQITTTTINGTLTVRLGRFLHLDSKLVFTDSENAVSYRLNHSRKMRSRELHYIDNPRFGLLVQILPLEDS